MKKKIAISAVMAVLFSAYAVWARWRTLGLGIYTLNTTVGKMLIHTWRPVLALAAICWIAMVMYISAQRKKALAEPKESRAEKKARIKDEKKAAEAEKKAAKAEKSVGKQPEKLNEAPANQGATVVLEKKTGFCSNCGAPMKEEQRFCTNCGCEVGKEGTL